MASTTGTPRWPRSAPPVPSAHPVPGVARQHVHRGDQLGVGVHRYSGFVPVKATPRALVAMAHLWIVHRHVPVLAHSVLQAHPAVRVIITSAVRAALHVLEQQLSQQLRRVNYRQLLRTVGGQPSLCLPG